MLVQSRRGDGQPGSARERGRRIWGETRTVTKGVQQGKNIVAHLIVMCIDIFAIGWPRGAVGVGAHQVVLADVAIDVDDVARRTVHCVGGKLPVSRLEHLTREPETVKPVELTSRIAGVGC